MPNRLLPEEILSEFKVIKSGENAVPVPFVKLIGIVFADN
jgi:hypothetical protein